MILLIQKHMLMATLIKSNQQCRIFWTIKVLQKIFIGITDFANSRLILALNLPRSLPKSYSFVIHGILLLSPLSPESFLTYNIVCIFWIQTTSVDR